MNLPIPNPADEGQKNDTPKGPSIEDLQKQIENLNKGIATYREDAKKAIRRAEEAENLAKQVKETSSKKDDDDLPLSPEDQKRLEAWAKKQGFATKEEIMEERARIQGESLRNIENQAIDEFLAKHPEYNEDDKWEDLKKEFSLYKQPTTLSDYKRILNKVYKDLNPKVEEATARARAEIETRKRLGFGGGSQRTGDNEGEMTVEKLQERYPRLSRDQIEARLSEIKSLYTKK